MVHPFHEMLRKITSSPFHDQMQRFAAPLKEHLGINHFWYYRITSSGHYSYLGTHAAWNEFCFDQSMLSHFSCLRHPTVPLQGIQIMKASADSNYQKVLQTAWEKFHINFNINLQSKTQDGIEAFGFASCFNDPKADERLLNELNLLRHFTKAFKMRHQKLFDLLCDNQVDLTSYFGPSFYESPKSIMLPFKRDLLLQKMGLGKSHDLTARELDVLKYVSNGYPASHIAAQLQLSRKTVENYIATIKSKLGCKSKIELIQKSQQILFFS